MVWVVLWVFFTCRELFGKNHIRDYRELLSRPLEGKRSYVTGDDLYGFITFCNKSLPAGSTFALAGIDDGSIDRRRVSYYLYPSIETEGAPEFILVYDDQSAPQKGYSLFASYGDKRYILKKRTEK